MLHKFPDEIDHEDLINHEVAHSLVQALLIGRPTSIELRADGNGYAEGVLLSELGLTETQTCLVGLHVSAAGVSQAFTTKAGLRGEWPEGCTEDMKNAMEYAHRLKSTHLFSFDVSANTLVHIAAGMSAYLTLKQFEDVSQAMRWRLSQKSWDTLWTAGQVEDFLILQPTFVTHTPLLTSTDWVRRWAAWGDATTDWLDHFDDGIQARGGGIYQRLGQQIAARRPIGGLRP